MILSRGSLTLEFFRYEALDPANSWFSCCLRMDDLERFYKICQSAGVPERNTGWPRLHGPKVEPRGGTVAHMVDPDGTLVRLIQN